MRASISRTTFLAGAGAGIAAAAAPHVARAQATKVRVAGANFADLFAEPFYCKAGGSFAKFGLDLDAQNIGNSAARVAAVSGGSVDLVMSDLISGVNAILAGVPIVLVAAGALYRMPEDEPTAILAVAQNSTLRDPKDLVGKTIAVPVLSGIAPACLRAWLPEHGVPESQVKLVELSPPAALAAIQRGTVDAGMLAEPYVTFVKGQVRALSFPFDTVASQSPNKQFVLSTWFGSKSFIEADKARAKAVVQAIYEGARWANTHHAETLDFLITSGGLNAAKSAGMGRAAFATSLTPGLVQPVLTVAESLKMIAKPVTAAQILPAG